MFTKSEKFFSSGNDDSVTFAWPDKVPFSWTHILFGLSIPFLFLFFSYALHIPIFIQCRPWLGWQILILLQIVSFIVLFFYPIIICKRQGYWPLFYFGGISDTLANLIDSVLLFLLLAFFIFVPIFILKMVLKLDNLPSFYIFSDYSNGIFVIIFIIFGFTVSPFAEELYFRGFLYNALKTKTSIIIALISQAAVFSLVHIYGYGYRNLLKLLIVFILGIALAIIYEKRKNLLVPSFVHCIINACGLIPFLILALQNYHVAASTMEEARIDPTWVSSSPPSYVIKQENGMAQWQYAIKSWGSKGSGQWKKEINAFKSVIFWFPGDQQAGAKARLGICTIYFYYLHDYRRAICEAEQLLVKYQTQEEERAKALATMGMSYYMLRDFQRSRIAFENVLKKYSKHKEAVDYAEKGLLMLKALNKI
jgi:membrane protease YdiL (CAAX protease family)